MPGLRPYISAPLRTIALKLCKNTKNIADKQKTSAIFALFKRNRGKNGG